jgi:hypothetical protein
MGLQRLIPQELCLCVRRPFTALGLAAALLCFASSAWAQQPVGTVTQLQGTAQVQRASDILSAMLMMLIQFHDKVTTAADSTLTITLVGNNFLPQVCPGRRGDGCLFVSPLSRLVLDRATVGTGVWLQEGGMRAVVAKSTITAPSNVGLANFEVHTPNATVAVHGTDFETAFIEGRPCPEAHTCMRYTTVGVNSGIVEVSHPLNPKAAAVLVAAGYETTIPCELAPTSPAPLGMENMGAPGYH